MKNLSTTKKTTAGRRTLILIISLFFLNLIYAQEGTPENLFSQKHFPEGMRWKEVLAELDMPMDTIYGSVYEIGADTIISNVSYNKVLRNGKFEGKLVREQDSQVWVKLPEYPEDIKLYDFNWDTSDIIKTEYIRENYFNGNAITFCTEERDADNIHATRVGDQCYQYLEDFDGVVIRDLGRVSALILDECLLGDKVWEPVIPGVIFKKVLWVEKDNKRIFFSDSPMEWIDYVPVTAQTGDVNGDGAVTITDVTMMVAHILGQKDRDFIHAVADANNDGDINITDVSEIIGIILDSDGQYELTVSDIQNSGCLVRTRGYDGEDEEEPIQTIILEKEGGILSVQLLDYTSTCGTYDFSVNTSVSGGDDGSPCSLVVDVASVTGFDIADCICPYNVSFTIRDLEPSTFYLKCWWYEGLVELTEGEPLVIKDVYEDVTIDGMNYTLRKAFHQAMVTKSERTGEVCIPSSVGHEGQNYTVTSIGRYAFRDNTALTKITIPRTVRNMDFEEVDGFNGNPFIGCAALESIEVEDGNPVLCVVDGVLLNKEKTRLHSFPAAVNRTSYTVPGGVTWIDAHAFAHNHHLVDVKMPDEVTALGASAFYDCTNLEEVRLSSKLGMLAEGLFENCKSLKTVTIPQGVTFLGGRLFAGCSSLTSVAMPESVTRTENAVFENCTSLKSVTLSPKLNQIHPQMFHNCSSLTEIHIPEGVKGVLTRAFQNCTALKSLDLPESVHIIGGSSFSGCKLESLYIRGVIDSYYITNYLFDGMGTQTKVYVQPSEVEKIQKVYKGTVYPL